MNGGALPTRKLLERVQTARARFLEEIRAERQLFEERFQGDTAEALAKSFKRWMEQNQKVMEALKEFDQATSVYFAAIAEHLK